MITLDSARRFQKKRARYVLFSLEVTPTNEAWIPQYVKHRRGCSVETRWKILSEQCELLNFGRRERKTCYSRNYSMAFKTKRTRFYV